MLDGGRGGSQASRLAERTAGAPEVESLSCSTCSLQPGGESSFFLPHFFSSSKAPGFLVKAPPGQAQVSLPSPYSLKHNLSFQDWSVWYQAASRVSQSPGEARWCPLCTSTQDPAALVTGMGAFSRGLQMQALMSESLVPSCWSASVLI